MIIVGGEEGWGSVSGRVAKPSREQPHMSEMVTVLVTLGRVVELKMEL